MTMKTVLVAVLLAAAARAAPVITLNAAGDVQAECDGGSAIANGYATFYSNLATATATNGGECAGAVSVSHDAPAPAGMDFAACTVMVVATITATDSCGGTTTASVSFMGRDTLAPTFAQAPQSVALGCEVSREAAETQLDVWRAQNAQASGADVCDSNPTLFNDAPSDMTPGACSFSVTSTFTVKDKCNNQATQTASFSYSCCTTTTAAPSSAVTITGGASQTHTCQGQDFDALFAAFLASNAGASASTTCPDTTVTWTHNGGAAPSSCSGEAAVTFVATDACGAHAEVTRNFKIVDLTAPVITAQASADFFVCTSKDQYAAANTKYQTWLAAHGNAQAADACAADLAWTHTGPADLPYQCDFSLNVAFDAWDNCGFSANTYALFTVIGCCVDTTTTTTVSTTTTTTEAPILEASSSGSSVPVGAVVGGLVGALLVAAIAVVVIRRRMQRSGDDVEQGSVLDDVSELSE